MGWPSAPFFFVVGLHKRVALTDYDRFPLKISIQEILFPCTKTYLPHHLGVCVGMTLAESSVPGREITDVKWRRSSPHEVSPTTGILYNQRSPFVVRAPSTAATGSSFQRWKTWWGMGRYRPKPRWTVRH
ncbi:hypothetical protein KCP74_16495 [Salmonella enterica subsp. enterica]|nr:hypothetical protein KCP74_16495 [Salmonella enterica subsp. enterica]